MACFLKISGIDKLTPVIQTPPDCSLLSISGSDGGRNKKKRKGREEGKKGML